MTTRRRALSLVELLVAIAIIALAFAIIGGAALKLYRVVQSLGGDASPAPKSTG